MVAPLVASMLPQLLSAMLPGSASSSSGGQTNRVTNVAQLWGEMLNMFGGGLKSVATRGPNVMIHASTFFWAILSIAFLCLCAYLLYVLLTKVHPRVPLIKHMPDVDPFLASHVQSVSGMMLDLNRPASRSVLQGLLPAKELGDLFGAFDGINRVLDDVVSDKKTKENVVTTREEQLQRMLRMTFELGFYVRAGPSGYVQLRAMATDLKAGSDLDKHRVKLLERFMDRSTRLQQAVERSSKWLHANLEKQLSMREIRLGNLRRAGVSHRTQLDEAQAEGTARAIHALAIHRLRLLLEYTRSIQRLYAVRGGFSIMTLYFQPFADEGIDRIKTGWITAAARYPAEFKSAMALWGRIGRELSLLPCKLAYNTAEERARHCRLKTNAVIFEFFDDSSRPADGEDDLESEGGEAYDPDRRGREAVLGRDTVEHLGLVGALKAIVSVIRMIRPTVQAFGHLFSQFLKRPFATLVRIFIVLLGTLFGFLLTLLHASMTFSLVAWALMALYAYVMTFAIEVWRTVIELLLIFLGFIAYVCLWMLDTWFGGAVSAVMQCDNLPDAWTTQPGFAYGNLYTRFGLMCMVPCTRRFASAGYGCCCKRTPRYQPDLCPQQIIYGIAHGLGSPDMYVLDRYMPDIRFSHKPLNERQAEVVKAFKVKMRWYQRCYAALDRYDYLNEHVCAMLPQLTKHLKLSVEDAKRMGVLCRECYCEHKRNKAKTGSGNASLFMDRGVSATRRNVEARKLSNTACRLLYETGPVPSSGTMSLTANAAVALMGRMMTICIVSVAVLTAAFTLLQAARVMMRRARRDMLVKT
jgi:hypothetical protein